MSSGWLIQPQRNSRLLMMPFCESRPIQAYTRSSSEVQNGSIMAKSSGLRHFSRLREMA